MHIEITSEYLSSQGLSDNFPNRFQSKVDKSGECWLWTACTDERGYGYINTGIGKTIIAPRASWILNRGPIPNGLCVLHNCPTGDNPTCVNPDHLWLGNRTQNMEDKIKKGRQLRGEEIGTHRLTEAQVIEARRLWITGEFTFQSLADRFGMSPMGMHKIITHKSWVHIPGIPI